MKIPEPNLKRVLNSPILVEAKLLWVILKDFPETKESKLMQVLSCTKKKFLHAQRDLNRLGLLSSKPVADVDSWGLPEFKNYYLDLVKEFLGSKMLFREQQKNLLPYLLVLIKSLGKAKTKNLLRYAIVNRQKFWFLKNKFSLEQILANKEMLRSVV